MRTGVAEYFGGTTYDSTFRAYRNGPLEPYGLATVRPYQAKRIPDSDTFITPGRGMGAFAVIELSETHDLPLTVTQIPVNAGGQRKLIYPVQFHVFHMAELPYAEDAEADVDALDQAIHEMLYADPTLGGICYQAGINEVGIHTVIDESDIVNEMTLTHFRVEFDAELTIMV